MTIKQINKLKPGRLRALTGMTVNALGELLNTIVPELVRRREQVKLNLHVRKRAVAAGAKRKLTPSQEVLLVLIYLRHNVAHEVTGQMFGVSADTSENLFHEVVPLLRELFPSNRFESQKRFGGRGPSLEIEQIDRILIDSFETPIPRPSNKERQKRVYSGKKKCHTLKSQVVSDPDGEVLDISAARRGPMADKRVYEASGVAEQFPSVSKQGDLGYQGTDGIEVPHKKPKGGAVDRSEARGESLAGQCASCCRARNKTGERIQDRAGEVSIGNGIVPRGSVGSRWAGSSQPHPDVRGVHWEKCTHLMVDSPSTLHFLFFGSSTESL